MSEYDTDTPESFALCNDCINGLSGHCDYFVGDYNHDVEICADCGEESDELRDVIVV